MSASFDSGAARTITESGEQLGMLTSNVAEALAQVDRDRCRGRCRRYRRPTARPTVVYADQVDVART